MTLPRHHRSKSYSYERTIPTSSNGIIIPPIFGVNDEIEIINSLIVQAGIAILPTAKAPEQINIIISNSDKQNMVTYAWDMLLAVSELTPAERIANELLVRARNLSKSIPADLSEYIYTINKLQKIIGMNLIRREYPDVFKDKESWIVTKDGDI